VNARRKVLALVGGLAAVWLATATLGRSQLETHLREVLPPRWEVTTSAAGPLIVSARVGWTTAKPVPMGEWFDRTYIWLGPWFILAHEVHTMI
jgi:hypothetical protein